MNSLVGRFAVVTKVSDGLGFATNDKKYIGKAKGQLVKLVSCVPNVAGFYITDFIDQNNDYIHYRFLKVIRGNISLVEK